jgi:histidyl-tRNA synthetase
VLVFVIDTAGGDGARDLTVILRRAGIGADRAFGGGGYKSQQKQAERSAAPILVTLRPDGYSTRAEDQVPLDLVDRVAGLVEDRLGLPPLPKERS